MTEQLVRIGPVDDWVRTTAHHLRADVVPVTVDQADLDRWLDAGRPLLVSADVRGLNAVLTRLVRREQAAEVPIGWVPDPDRGSRALAEAFGLPSRPTLAANVATGDEVRPVRLVRDDHGGLLLQRGSLTAVTGRRLGAWRRFGAWSVAPWQRFGAQSYHDDTRIADGKVRRIEVRPDYTADCAVQAAVGRGRTTGRSVQTACDEATATVDGKAYPRPVTRWTWYADPRQHWLLRSAEPPA